MHYCVPRRKYEYQKLPMDLCNSPDVFQEKMNELFAGLECGRAYIDDISIVNNGTYEDNLTTVDKVLIIL